MSSTEPQRGRRRQKKPPDPPVIFFTDRSLGKILVPTAIRVLGYTVHTIWDVYPQEHLNRSVSDETWLWDSAANGWVCLTYDRLRRPKSVPEALAESGAKVFRFEQALKTAAQQIAAFTVNQNRIRQWASKEGPRRRVIRKATTDPDGIP